MDNHGGTRTADYYNLRLKIEVKGNVHNAVVVSQTVKAGTGLAVRFVYLLKL